MAYAPSPDAISRARLDANRRYYRWLRDRAPGIADPILTGNAEWLTGRRLVPGTRLPQLAALTGTPWIELLAHHPDLASEPVHGADPDHLGETLHRMRLARGWTVSELADAADVNPDHIRRYEDGRGRTQPRVGACVLTALGHRVGKFITTHPQHAGRCVRWTRVSVQTHPVRYFPMPGAALVVEVTGLLPAGLTPPGLAHVVSARRLASRADLAPLPVRFDVPAPTTVTGWLEELADQVSAHLDVGEWPGALPLADRHALTRTPGGRWRLWVPPSGRAFPTLHQANNPLRSVTSVPHEPGGRVQARLDTSGTWSQPVSSLAGPGADLVCGPSDRGPLLVIRVLSATHPHTGQVPAEAAGVLGQVALQARPGSETPEGEAVVQAPSGA